MGMGNAAGGFAVIIVLVLLGLGVFFIYFIFKQIQFVLQAINLYKEILNREEAIIKLLIDIRDGTKRYSENMNESRPQNVMVNDFRGNVANSGINLEKKAKPEENPFAKLKICSKCGSAQPSVKDKCVKCGSILT